MGSNFSCLLSKTYEQDISIVNESHCNFFVKYFIYNNYSQ